MRSSVRNHHRRSLRSAGSRLILCAFALVATPAAGAGPEMGACCFPKSVCEELSAADCADAGGDYQGDGTTCSPFECVPGGACCLPEGRCVETSLQFCVLKSGEYVGGPCAMADCSSAVGACCLPDSSCQELPGPLCEEAGGLYQGDDTVCFKVFCDCGVPGACCFPGFCKVRGEKSCEDLGGLYFGDGTICTELTCGKDLGACCLPDGTCAGDSASNCDALGGAYLGDESSCGAGCPVPVGACCLADDRCFVDFEPACQAAGGHYQGNGSDCTVPCTPAGACCFQLQVCTVVSVAQCDAIGGYTLEPGTDCASACPFTGRCCFPDGPSLDLPEDVCTALGGTPSFDSCVAKGGCTRHFVPGDYATIQLAINKAKDGDEILVAPGVYPEAIDLRGKPLTLRSTDGPSVTLIDATGQDRTTVRGVTGKGPDTIIDGFTITGGTSDVGGGMHIAGSSPTVIDCVFVANTATVGGGLYVSVGSPLVQGCTFVSNTAAEGGGIAVTLLSNATLDGCTFVNNQAADEGGAVHVLGSTLAVTGTSFTGNTAAIGADVYARSAVVEADGSLGGDVANAGCLLPGVDGVGTVTVDGTYAQRVPSGVSTDFTGELEIDIVAADNDRLDVGGTASLGGALRLAFDDTAGALSGSGSLVLTTASFDPERPRFDLIQQSGLPAGQFVRLEYASGAVGGGVTVFVEDLDSLFGLDDPQFVGLPGLPSGVAVGDLDGEGGDDLAVILPGADPATDPGSVLVLINQGVDPKTGEVMFVTVDQPAVGVDPSDITIGDFDGDLDADVAVSNRIDESVTLLFNAGDGTFGDPVTVPNVGAEPSALAAGNFFGASFLDLAVALAGDDAVAILAGDGLGGFVKELTVPVGEGPFSLDPGDICDPTDFFLATADRDDDTVSVIRIIGGVPQPRIVLPVGSTPVALISGDINRDGLRDIAVATEGAGAVTLLLRETLDAFVPAGTLQVGDAPRAITVLDVDRDDDLDIVVVANDADGAPIVQLVRNDQLPGEDLVFASATTIPAGTAPRFVDRGDLDEDGASDLIVLDTGSAASGATARFGPVASANVLRNVAVCAADVDGSGDVGFTDLLSVMAAWGPCPPKCPEDIDGSGDVGFTDLLSVMADWGPCGG